MSQQEKETTLPAKDRKRGKTAEEEEEDLKRDRKSKERIAPLSDIKTERKLGQGSTAWTLLCVHLCTVEVIFVSKSYNF